MNQNLYRKQWLFKLLSRAVAYKSVQFNEQSCCDLKHVSFISSCFITVRLQEPRADTLTVFTRCFPDSKINLFISDIIPGSVHSHHDMFCGFIRVNYLTQVLSVLDVTGWKEARSSTDTCRYRLWPAGGDKHQRKNKQKEIQTGFVGISVGKITLLHFNYFS